MALFTKRKKPIEPPRLRRNQVDSGVNGNDSTNTSSYTFRRNQTLTGSVSSHVQSISENSAHLQSPRVQTHALTKKRRHISLVLVIVIAASGLLYALINQFTAKVDVVATPEASIQLDNQYSKTIQDYFQARPMERLRFLTDSPRLLRYLRAAHPEVKNLRQNGYSGFGASQFALEFRKPIAGWNINGRQEFVDASGVAFTQNYYQAPSVQIIDKSGLQVASGQAVASNRFLAFVGQIVGQATAQGLTVTQVIIPELTTRQVDLVIKDASYPVKLSVDRGPGEQVEDMTRAIRWLQANQLTPKYLDVRVSGKAFYM